MGWVFLEVLAALLIAVGIVWWTLPKAPTVGAEGAREKRGDDPGPSNGDNTEPKETRVTCLAILGPFIAWKRPLNLNSELAAMQAASQALLVPLWVVVRLSRQSLTGQERTFGPLV